MPFEAFDIVSYTVAGAVTGLYAKHLARPIAGLFLFQVLFAVLLDRPNSCLNSDAYELYWVWSSLAFVMSLLATWAFMYLCAFARLISLTWANSDGESSKANDPRYNAGKLHQAKMIFQWLAFPALFIAAWRWIDPIWSYVLVCIGTFLWWIGLYFWNRSDLVWYVYLATGARDNTRGVNKNRGESLSKDNGWVKFDPNPNTFHFTCIAIFVLYAIAASIIKSLFPLDLWPQFGVTIGLTVAFLIAAAIVRSFPDATAKDHNSNAIFTANIRSRRQQHRDRRAAKNAENKERKASELSKKCAELKSSSP